MGRVAITSVAMVTYLICSAASAENIWTEGKNYAVIRPAQPTTVPAGKIEVMEVFSYGCVACNQFQPTIEELKRHLATNAQMVFLPASFNSSEDWPMFQRAYFAAQHLGIAEWTHQAIFDAIWKSGELAIIDSTTNRLKSHQPTLEDAARCYARIAGIKAQSFMAAADAFDVYWKIGAADAQVAAMKVPGTPCIVVNGKYRVERESLRSNEELIDLVNFLVNKETPANPPAAKKASPARSRART